MLMQLREVLVPGMTREQAARALGTTTRAPAFRRAWAQLEAERAERTLRLLVAAMVSALRDPENPLPRDLDATRDNQVVREAYRRALRLTG